MDFSSAFYSVPGPEGDRRRDRVLRARSTRELNVLAVGPRGPLARAAASIVLQRQIAVACEWTPVADRG